MRVAAGKEEHALAVADPELPPMRSPDGGGGEAAFAVARARERDAAAALDLPPDVRWWTAGHVAAWASHIGFGHCADSLVDNNVTGEVLLVADVALLRDCDVSAAGDRVLFLRARDRVARQHKQPQRQRSRYAALLPYHYADTSGDGDQL